MEIEESFTWISV